MQVRVYVCYLCILTSSSLHTCRPSLTRCMHWLTLTYQWALACVCLCCCDHCSTCIAMKCWCHVRCLFFQEKLLLRTINHKVAQPYLEQGDLVQHALFSCHVIHLWCGLRICHIVCTSAVCMTSSTDNAYVSYLLCTVHQTFHLRPMELEWRKPSNIMATLTHKSQLHSGADLKALKTIVEPPRRTATTF